MDPPGMMMNDGSFDFTEIWLNGVQSGAKLDLRRVQFGHSFAQFGDDDPMMLDNRGIGARKRPEEDEKGKGVCTSSANCMNDIDIKRLKTSLSMDDNDEVNDVMEENSEKPVDQKPAELPKQDFIHVRARRGQATDSHSLAERARREKISERMRILQDIVPGCNKVIGKALVLDEIINYIQSLQRQVEFLSMKLEAVNSRQNPNMDAFCPTDTLFQYGQQGIDITGVAFASEAAKEYNRGSSPDSWLHMQIGGGFERTS